MNYSFQTSDPHHIGVLAAVAAFLIWGFSPLYFRAVDAATAAEVLAHRVVWSLLFSLVLIVIAGEMRNWLRILLNGRMLLVLATSALLVTVNWYGFIWAVTHEMALEASMGYYIMPIFMVLLGRIFLDERLNRNQWISFGLVVLGVLNQLYSMQQLPWLALMLATSFGLYSLVRKKAPVDPLVGLATECLLLTPIALGYLLFLMHNEHLVFTSKGIGFDLLLAGTVLVTALPLILFAFSAKRLRLGTVGLLQYINPTCQFILALFLFGEPFSQHHLHTFLLIWSGLALFSIDSHYRLKKLR
ncbi:MAG: EamA family transporter RarD [Candidatus Sedimenticola sp. (ex Thyasira tokunagai)]